MSTPAQPNDGQQPNERVVYVERQPEKKKGGCMKWGLIILGALIVIGIIAGALSGGDDSDSSSDTAENTATAPADPETAPEDEAAAPAEEAPAEEDLDEAALEEAETTDFAIGETYTTSDDVAITVDSITTQTDVFGDSYLTATVTYVNNGDEQASFNPYNWSAQNPSGVISDRSITGLDGALSSGDLAPGGTITGNLHFEGTEPGEYRIVWEPSFSFSGDTATWITTL